MGTNLYSSDCKSSFLLSPEVIVISHGNIWKWKGMVKANRNILELEVLLSVCRKVDCLSGKYFNFSRTEKLESLWTTMDILLEVENVSCDIFFTKVWISYCNNNRIFQSFTETGFWVLTFIAVPERWWTILCYVESTGNCGGSRKRFWRANRLFEQCIGAKDSSNLLVAGFLWSFPQDSWSQKKKVVFQLNYFFDVEQRMRGNRACLFMQTYYQTAKVQGM